MSNNFAPSDLDIRSALKLPEYTLAVSPDSLLGGTFGYVDWESDMFVESVATSDYTWEVISVRIALALVGYAKYSGLSQQRLAEIVDKLMKSPAGKLIFSPLVSVLIELGNIGIPPYELYSERNLRMIESMGFVFQDGLKNIDPAEVGKQLSNLMMLAFANFIDELKLDLNSVDIPRLLYDLRAAVYGQELTELDYYRGEQVEYCLMLNSALSTMMEAESEKSEDVMELPFWYERVEKISRELADHLSLQFVEALQRDELLNDVLEAYEEISSVLYSLEEHPHTRIILDILHGLSYALRALKDNGFLLEIYYDEFHNFPSPDPVVSNKRGLTTTLINYHRAALVKNILDKPTVDNFCSWLNTHTEFPINTIVHLVSELYFRVHMPELLKAALTPCQYETTLLALELDRGNFTNLSYQKAASLLDQAENLLNYAMPGSYQVIIPVLIQTICAVLDSRYEDESTEEDDERIFADKCKSLIVSTLNLFADNNEEFEIDYYQLASMLFLGNEYLDYPANDDNEVIELLEDLIDEFKINPLKLMLAVYSTWFNECEIRKEIISLCETYIPI